MNLSFWNIFMNKISNVCMTMSEQYVFVVLRYIIWEVIDIKVWIIFADILTFLVKITTNFYRLLFYN